MTYSNKLSQTALEEIDALFASTRKPGIVITCHNGRILWSNPAVQALLEVSYNDILGLGLHTFISQKDKRDHMRLFLEDVRDDAAHGDENLNFTADIIDSDGLNRTLSVSVHFHVVDTSGYFIFGFSAEAVNGVACETRPCPDLSQCRILFADDNKTNQMLMSHILRPTGATLTLVDNGFEALEAITQAPYDIVILDMLMPVMTGQDATRIIRSSGTEYADIPILALTAMDDFDVPHVLALYGIDDALSKPYDRSALFEAIARLRKKPRCAQNSRNESENYTDKRVECGEEDFHEDRSDNVVAALSKMFGSDAAHEMDALFHQFRRDIRTCATDLECAIISNNLTSASRTCHTLSGLAGTYDLGQLSALAKSTYRHAVDGRALEFTRLAQKTIISLRYHLKNLDQYIPRGHHKAAAYGGPDGC